MSIPVSLHFQQGSVFNFFQPITCEMIFQCCSFLLSQSTLPFSLVIPIICCFQSTRISILLNLIDDSLSSCDFWATASKLSWSFPVWNSVLSIILTAHIFLLPWQLIFSLLSYCLLLFLKTLFQPSIMFYYLFLGDISFSMTLNTNFMMMLTNDIVLHLCATNFC